jgi:hypothetical protein
MSDLPPGNSRRAVRFMLILAGIAAVVWVTFIVGQVMFGRKELQKQPQPGQAMPAPEGRA